ncbi:MAG: tryptophan synthase subunit alpha [Thermoplasmata archaeon]
MISKSLIPFITAGDPDKQSTLKFLRVLDKYADAIELGIPFTDPMADGPTIQNATKRALESNTSMEDVLHIVETFRKTSDTPIILMTYYNPVYVFGVERFVRSAACAGVDATIVVDLPLEESDEYLSACLEHGLENTFLAAPNTDQKRLRKIDGASGFVYLVSNFNTTGSKHCISELTFSAIKRTKNYCVKPVVVGFGISRPSHVKEIMAAGADGVVIGSALIECIEEYRSEAGEFLEEKMKRFKEVIN